MKLLMKWGWVAHDDDGERKQMQPTLRGVLGDRGVPCHRQLHRFAAAVVVGADRKGAAVLPLARGE